MVQGAAPLLWLQGACRIRAVSSDIAVGHRVSFQTTPHVLELAAQSSKSMSAEKQLLVTLPPTHIWQGLC